MEQLYVFGTGNAAVTRCYNTCFALKTENEYFMTDAGGGNGILRILNEMQVDLFHIHHIFVTHEHTDHILGIVWMVRMIGTRIKSGKYEGDLFLYCHANLIPVIDTLCRLTLQKKFYELLGQRIHLTAVADGESRNILGYQFTFFDIHSTKAEQYGFSLTLKNGKRFTCCGDEPFHPSCSDYVKNSNWLLHEAFCLYGERKQFKPYEKHHSTVKEACELAQQMGVENLVLWHTEDSNIDRRKELYGKEGRSYFSGNLYVPDDGEILEL